MNNIICSICLEDIANLNCETTICNHKYHTNCYKLLCSHNIHICPICRTPFQNNTPSITNITHSYVNFYTQHLLIDVMFFENSNTNLDNTAGPGNGVINI